MRFKKFTADARQMIVKIRAEGVGLESPRLLAGMRRAHTLAGDEITASDLQLALMERADQPAPMMDVHTTVTVSDDGVTTTRVDFNTLGSPN